jgi:hypothetical protein
MTTYSDTLSVPEWKTVLEDTLTNLASGRVIRRMTLADAKAEVFQMMKYWCVEIGPNYRGDAAAHKFKKCYRWDDYYDAKNDPDRYVNNQFDIMVATKKTIDTWMDVLNTNSSVPIDDVWMDPRTRQGMLILTEAAKKRYRDEAPKFEPIYAQVCCALTSRPIILLSQTSKYWYRDLKTLRTEGPLMTELVFRHGDGLIDMKRNAMTGEER